MTQTMTMTDSPTARRTRTRNLRVVLATACASVLAACAQLPAATQDAQPRSAASYATERSFAGPAGRWPRDA
ncbi:MAG TPA: hypothetical protein VJO99_23540, partial [Burkholderiaceae bacterium]|nr:hypothetical protein [Burkholderiaceae bacterium]